MNKILYTGPTCTIGIARSWNFTKNKLYDIHPYDEYTPDVFFIVSDNNLEYYLNTYDVEHYKPVKILDKSLPITLSSLDDMPDNNFILVELDKWRDKQIESILQ
jgi:hypothetical protein